MKDTTIVFFMLHRAHRILPYVRIDILYVYLRYVRRQKHEAEANHFSGAMSGSSGSSMEPTAASRGAHPSPTVASSASGSTGDQQSAAAAAAVAQTPHTLRLLRLAVSGTADHSRRARTLLSDLARRSSPDLLWDLLGRLIVGSSSSTGTNSTADIRSGLYSSKWSERENAAATMGTIAANLPGVDRRGFLSDPHEDDNDDVAGGGASNSLW